MNAEAAYSCISQLQAVRLPQVNVPFCAAPGSGEALCNKLHGKPGLLKGIVNLVAYLKCSERYSGSNYRLLWMVFIACGLAASVLYGFMYNPDKRTFPKLYEK